MTDQFATMFVRDTGSGVLLYTVRTKPLVDCGVIYELSGLAPEETIHALVSSLILDFLNSDISAHEYRLAVIEVGREWREYMRIAWS